MITDAARKFTYEAQQHHAAVAKAMVDTRTRLHSVLGKTDTVKDLDIIIKGLERTNDHLTTIMEALSKMEKEERPRKKVKKRKGNNGGE